MYFYLHENNVASTSRIMRKNKYFIAVMLICKNQKLSKILKVNPKEELRRLRHHRGPALFYIIQPGHYQTYHFPPFIDTGATRIFNAYFFIRDQ